MAAGEGGAIGNERTHLAQLRVHVTLREPSFQNKLYLLTHNIESKADLRQQFTLELQVKRDFEKSSQLNMSTF